MLRNPTVLMTLIGLPIFFVIALGVAFGASYVSRTLRQDPTLNQNANIVITTNTANTNAADFEQYSLAISTMTSTVYDRMTQTSLLINATPNQGSALNTAKIILAAVCWLAAHEEDIQFFPSGTVRQEFIGLMNRYAAATESDSACRQVTDDAQLQASRLMTLDDDGDTLNAIAEYWYDTNQFSQDTDNDGFRDNEEIGNGFNPRGPGPAAP
jgi:hypothetical protein